MARYLALGIPLRDICSTLGLNHASWSRTISEPIFQEELRRVEAELEDRVLDDASSDPTLVQLKNLTRKAVETLSVELENTDVEQGASASTRIKAANSILDRAGYSSLPTTPTVNISFQLSKEKLDLVTGKAASVSPQPDSIEG